MISIFVENRCNTTVIHVPPHSMMKFILVALALLAADNMCLGHVLSFALAGATNRCGAPPFGGGQLQSGNRRLPVHLLADIQDLAGDV